MVFVVINDRHRPHVHMAGTHPLRRLRRRLAHSIRQLMNRRQPMSTTLFDEDIGDDNSSAALNSSRSVSFDIAVDWPFIDDDDVLGEYCI